LLFFCYPINLFLDKEYILLYRARHKFSKPSFFSYAALAPVEVEETDNVKT